MLEMLSVMFFGLIVYTFLVVIPTLVEKFSSQEFREAYFANLSSKHVNTFGR